MIEGTKEINGEDWAHFQSWWEYLRKSLLWIVFSSFVNVRAATESKKSRY